MITEPFDILAINETRQGYTIQDNEMRVHGSHLRGMVDIGMEEGWYLTSEIISIMSVIIP